MGTEKIVYITPSFYSSVMYWRKREDANLQELLDLLDHKPTPTTELMQAGIDFENEVQKVCETDGYVSDDNVANEVAAEVKGALWQVPIKTEVKVDGSKIMIFGRMDCALRDWVKDIKRVKSYDLGKYFDSIQHLVYMQATNIPNFKYLVKCGNNLYTEEYHWGADSKQLLQERVTDLIHWLKSVHLYDRYAEHWEVKQWKK